jgi:hypothetical protein
MMAIEMSVEKSPKIAISALPHRRRTLRLFQGPDRMQLNFFRAHVSRSPRTAETITPPRPSAPR